MVLDFLTQQEVIYKEEKIVFYIGSKYFYKMFKVDMNVKTGKVN